jgi:hypothetical protein
MMAQRGDARAKLIGQRAQIPAAAEALVNRGALAVTADRAQTGHEGGHRWARALSFMPPSHRLLINGVYAG